jgi:serine/threonine protein kinase
MDFMIQLLRGVSIMHSFNIYHRDIKPQNIMIRGSLTPEICLIDFGLSTEMDNI